MAKRPINTSALIGFGNLRLDSFIDFDSQPIIHDPRHGQTAQFAIKRFGYRLESRLKFLVHRSLYRAVSLLDTTLQRTNKLLLENRNDPDATMELVGPMLCFLGPLAGGRGGGICALRSHMMGPE